MKEKNKKILMWVLDLVLNVVVIFALVFVIQKWLIAPFDISGGSMCNTFNYTGEKCLSGFGDKILINEATYLFGDPDRGDVVVFIPEGEDRYYIKRVIGLPGEVVEIIGGNVYVTPVGGERVVLDEEYLNSDNKGRTLVPNGVSRFEIPADHYFMLGDNRRASTDSRTCFMHTSSSDCSKEPEKSFVSRDLIRGKAWVRWWPLSRLGMVDEPEYNL